MNDSRPIAMVPNPVSTVRGTDRIQPSVDLSPGDELALLTDAANGNPVAEQRLVRAYLPLVRRLARRYARYGSRCGDFEADLVQVGAIGLLSAVRKYDPRHGARLGTYAQFWIKSAMQEQVVRGWSLVRLGKSAAHRALFFGLHRGEAAIPHAEDALHRLVQRFRLPAADVMTMARRLAHRDLSLDGPVGIGQEPGPQDSFADLLPSPGPTPEDVVAEGRLHRLWTGLLDKALAMLPDREAYIVRVRHLYDPAPTFEAVGRELGISKDRVRQLEQRALARLRQSLSPMVADHGLPALP